MRHHPLHATSGVAWLRPQLLCCFVSGLLAVLLPGASMADREATRPPGPPLDRQLVEALERAGFTGTVESTLETRLGRPVDEALAGLGRLVFFDPILGLHGDNSCAGCHGPANGFGDSQSIAIGVDNNGLVGPDRSGPRNQRKAPLVINNAFYPKLMLNGRFVALSGDPFDNSQGFQFPNPEGTTRFPANDPQIRHLLVAQAHIPSTELVAMAGFTGTQGTIGPDFDAFDDGHGTTVPPPDLSGFRNEPIRDTVLARFNATPAYLTLFSDILNGGTPLPPGGITFAMVVRALAEFEISMTFADAPIDRYARGNRHAMSVQQKRGALLFFGKAGCVECHTVAGAANEMFSDFENHVLGVPQLAPVFGVGTGDVIFDGPGRDQDYGAEQVTGDPADRYEFRTSPLRNVAVQPAFFHNGAFTKLEDAIRHHLDARKSARRYDPRTAGVDRDLQLRMGPIEPVLARLDPLVATPIRLDRHEIDDLVAFVGEALLDARARPEYLCDLLPQSVPSGRPVANFQGCDCVHRIGVAQADNPDGLPAVATVLVPGGLQVWPNPARGPISMAYEARRGGAVSVGVYDIAGRRVRQLSFGASAPGRRLVLWDGRDDRGRAVASGTYVVQLESASGTSMRRVTLLR